MNQEEGILFGGTYTGERNIGQSDWSECESEDTERDGDTHHYQGQDVEDECAFSCGLSGRKNW